jgi:hypothetical protein
MVESFVDICYKVIHVNRAVSQISQGLRRFELLLIASSICLSDAVSSGNSVFLNEFRFFFRYQSLGIVSILKNVSQF